MSKGAQELVNLIRDVVSEEIIKQDTTTVCVISSITKDGLLNIIIPPDRETVIQGIINISKYDFAQGDSAILYKIQNNINNSFVIAKLSPSLVEGTETLQRRIEEISEILAGGTGTGGVSGIASLIAGAGLNGGVITTGGTISLGSPSDIGSTSDNSVTGSTHSHKIDGTIPRKNEIISAIRGSDGDEILPDGNRVVTITANAIGAIPLSDKGVAGGVVSLDANAQIPEVQLPSATYENKGIVQIGDNLNIENGVLSGIVQEASSNKIYINSWDVSSSPLGKYQFFYPFGGTVKYTDVNYSVEVLKQIDDNVYIEAPCTIVKNNSLNSVTLYTDDNSWTGLLILTSGGKNDSQQGGHLITNANSTEPLIDRTKLNFSKGLVATDDPVTLQTKITSKVIVQCDNRLLFPRLGDQDQGEDNILYIDKSTRTCYIFDTAHSSYVVVGQDPEHILSQAQTNAEALIDSIDIIDGNKEGEIE